MVFCRSSVAQSLSTVPQIEAWAHERLAANDANGALTAYQRLGELVPNSATYQDQIGFLLAATNRIEEAIPHLFRATELDPKMAAAWFHLGAAQAVNRQTESAVQSMERA